MGMNSQSRVPPLAARGILGCCDQRAGDTRITDEAGLHHREEEEKRHIETGTTKVTDRPAMKAAAAAAVETGVVLEAEAEAEAREGIDRHFMEAHPVEK